MNPHSRNAAVPSAPGTQARGLLVGANYHPHDSEPATWHRDAAMMRDAGITVVRLGHLAWDTFEPADGEFRFEWFDECMDLMRDYGIGVILDIAVRPAPLWLHRKHPSIDVTDPNGNRLYANHRYMDDVGDPHFRSHAKRFAEQLVRRYADHPALAALGIDNEPGDGPISYSDTVRARFIDWLRAKYATPEALNRAWAGHRWSRRIGDFDDVGLPAPGNGGAAPERVLDFRRFISDEVNTYLLELFDIVETHAPGVPTTTNMWYYSPKRHFDYAPIAYSGRMTRAGNGFYPGNSIMDDSGLRHALFGIARIQYESTNPFWCTEFTTMTATPGSIRKSAYASLMLGNQLVCGWTWQTMHAGEEQFLQGMVDWDGKPNRKLDEYRRIAEEFAKIGSCGFPYRPRAEIAVALDFPSQIASAAFPERHDGQAQVAFDAVLDRNLDVRLVDVSQSDLDYRILIVPGMLVLDEAAAAKIREFVEQGGTAIMTSYSATLDANGQVFAETRPGRLADVFGIRVGSYEEPQFLNELAHGRSGDNGIDLVLDGQPIAVTAPRFDLIAPDTADILAATGLDRDRPIVTANEYGAGRAIYIGLPARREILDAVLDAAIDRLGIRQHPAVPKGVMARRIDDRHVLYLNLDAEPKQIELSGDAKSLLNDTHHKGGLTLGAYDAEFIELDPA